MSPRNKYEAAALEVSPWSALNVSFSGVSGGKPWEDAEQASMS